jgi:hypothetical protein
MTNSVNEWICGEDTSEEMRKLLNSLDYSSASKAEIEKHQRKVRLQQVKDQPFIVSTPSFCYAYLLYKLRKLSGLNQEEMSFKIVCQNPLIIRLKIEYCSFFNTLHLTMHCFGITPVEFSQLYWNIQSIIQKQW